MRKTRGERGTQRQAGPALTELDHGAARTPRPSATGGSSERAAARKDPLYRLGRGGSEWPTRPAPSAPTFPIRQLGGLYVLASPAEMARSRWRGAGAGAALPCGRSRPC